jgi:uncharacterized membrane protein
MVQDPNQSSFGLAPNVAAGLAALFSWVGGLVILLGKPPQPWVRFVAVQSIVLAILYVGVIIALNILSVLFAIVHLGILSLLLVPIIMIIFVIWAIATLVTAIQGFQGKAFRLPFVAAIADKYVPTSTSIG